MPINWQITWQTNPLPRSDEAASPPIAVIRCNVGVRLRLLWADTAYRSTANEKYLADHALRSQIHRKKPKGKPMPRHTARANGRKSKVRAAVEHVFAQQKGPMGLFIRTIGLARATTKIGLANLVYNMKRMLWLAAQTVPI